MGAPSPRLSGRPPRAAVRAAVAQSLGDLEPGHLVLVALSGGPDSLALMAATVTVAAQRGLLCGAVVIDHGLQGGSDEVAATAAAQAGLLGCEHVRVMRVRVAEGPGSGGPEAAARSARYAALAEATKAANGRPAASCVLLGHTREDQAETVLLGLARGSGLRSLAGMAARTGLYRRPLLELPRAVVRAAADEQARQDPRLAPWADPHNDADRFLRARVRSRALPQLEAELGRGVVVGLTRTAALAREDADALDGWADAVWRQLVAEGAVRLRGRDEPWEASGPGGDLDRRVSPPQASPPDLDRQASREDADDPGEVVAELLVSALNADRGRDPDHSIQGTPGLLPIAVGSRIVRQLLLRSGCPATDLTARHVRAVLSLVDGPARNRAEIALPGGRRARREGSVMRVRV